MRKDGQVGRCITVHLRTAQFEGFSSQRQLPSATNGTVEIYQAACGIMGELWDRKTPLRQIGVQMSKVSHDPYRQYSIFDNRYERLEKLDSAVDGIRSKYGEDAICRASVLSFDNPRKGAQSVAFHVKL